MNRNSRFKIILSFYLIAAMASTPVFAENEPNNAEGDSPSASPSSGGEIKPPGAFPPVVEEASAIKKLGKMIRYLFDFEKDQDGPQEGQARDAQAGVPTGMNDKGITGLQPWMMEVFPVPTLENTRPWKMQDYRNQSSALGWTPEVFNVPAGMRERVEFWTDIYARYTTDQGVIHDSIHVEIVYQPVDFSVIMADQTLTRVQKAISRERLVETQKEQIIETLKRLQTVKSAENLQGEDLRIWKLFEKIDDPLKFEEAAKGGRVRFQLGQKDRFHLGIYYSGRYLQDMENIFRQEGLPIELTRLPFVESSFNIFARSKVGASGIWQFMRRTARPFMTVNSEIDERNDPIKATWSSAKLLKQNYQMLQSWPLAITGYNHGPSGVRQIVNKLKTRDISEIVNTYSSRTFGFASENFYACFLAAIEVERNAEKYFGKVRWSNPIENYEVALQKPLSYEHLVAWFDGNWDLAKFFNPHLLSRSRSVKHAIPARSFVRVPMARKQLVDDFLAGKMSAKLMLSAAKDWPLPELPGLTPKGAPLVATGPGVSMQSQPGSNPPNDVSEAPTPESAEANFSQKIKGAVGVDSSQIAMEKNLTDVNLLSNTVPGGDITTQANLVESTAVAKVEEEEAAPRVPAVYKVRRGDTLFRIAKRFKTSVEELRDLNNLSVNIPLRSGQKLRLPGGSQ